MIILIISLCNEYCILKGSLKWLHQSLPDFFFIEKTVSKQFKRFWIDESAICKLIQFEHYEYYIASILYNLEDSNDITQFRKSIN